jgi:hypothetical protein
MLDALSAGAATIVGKLLHGVLLTSRKDRADALRMVLSRSSVFICDTVVG